VSYQPPTDPLPISTGSSPTKLRRRGGRFRWVFYVLGALFAGFILLMVAALAFMPDEAFTTSAATVTVTTEGETKTVTITPEPESTTVTKTVTITPKPETTTITVRPEPEVRTETRTVTVAPPADAGGGGGAGPEVVPPAPEPVAPPAVAPYPNCTAVRDAGAAPISPGDPGWNPRLDADGDGQACGGD
jgi:hypothetical protein